jgi:hypothetical protein
MVRLILMVGSRTLMRGYSQIWASVAVYQAAQSSNSIDVPQRF